MLRTFVKGLIGERQIVICARFDAKYVFAPAACFGTEVEKVQLQLGLVCTFTSDVDVYGANS